MGSECCKAENKENIPLAPPLNSCNIQELRTLRTVKPSQVINKNSPENCRADIYPSKRMNEQTEAVLEAEIPLGLPKIDKKYLRESFNDYPELGPYNFPDGSTYIGQFKKGKRHGYGKLIYKTGSVYEGLWLDDQGQIYGRYIKEDGEVYCGQIKDSKPHGTGYALQIDRSKYEGGWTRGIKNGRGKETWADGSQYIGDYKDSKREGKGYFIFGNGATYEGDFKKNFKHGYGTLLNKDGSRYDGDWENNKKNGFGVFSFKNGSRYEGNYLNDLKEGFGEFKLYFLVILVRMGGFIVEIG